MLDIQKILGSETLDGLSPEDSLVAIAILIDHALDHDDLSLTARALVWSDKLEPRLELQHQRALLEYFRANAWAHRQSFVGSDSSAVWAWDQEAMQQQILCLRRAYYSPAFQELDPIRQCQIRTNLANQLDTAGRFIEARALWSEVLRDRPDFWMARGNRGKGLLHYAHALYDPGHEAVFASSAYRDLQEAIRHVEERPEFGEPAVGAYFEEVALHIGRRYDLDAIADDYRPDGFDLGSDDLERAYRAWCLNETLFLNPLCDLGPNSIAATDVLTLSSFVTRGDESRVLIGFFNQLKQEFVSARWLHFEGIESGVPHLSDHGVLLYDTLDYTALNLGVEKVKLAFRMSYSLLDKVAYFLNHYMKLGIAEKRISFRQIWREKTTGPVRAEFLASENWPLRGLYWLSKDIFEPEFKDLTEPDARSLHELRNHLEHKYVKVHWMQVPAGAGKPGKPELFHDSLAHSISRDDLERRSLRILKLARSALIYLSLGMHVEERRRKSMDDPNMILGTIPLLPLKTRRSDGGD